MALHRTDASEHFFEVKWLHQVVVGAVVEPRYPVGQLSAGTQHNDWHTRRVDSKLLDQAQSIAVGKGSIK
ncbi:hypothetical protein BSY16_6324 (plasmid) [Sinorhizobium sp. RAC02]|nr:hypothetical protein BSY16_6324 [Sinorhizobium sp. RAC02]